MDILKIAQEISKDEDVSDLFDDAYEAFLNSDFDLMREKLNGVEELKKQGQKLSKRDESIRETLNEHKENPSCILCNSKEDLRIADDDRNLICQKCDREIEEKAYPDQGDFEYDRWKDEQMERQD